MADKFNPDQLKSAPAFELCDKCTASLAGTTMRPNESVALECVTCLKSERQALLLERRATRGYLEWLLAEVKAREGELAERAATIVALEARMGHLESEMKSAIARTPVEFRTPAPRIAYLGPSVMVALDRQCADLCTGNLNLHRLLDKHKGLKTRMFPVNSIARLCKKAKAELEKEGMSDTVSVILWGGLGVFQDSSYHRENAVREAIEALTELEQHPKVDKLVYTTFGVDARNYEHYAFEDSLLKSLPPVVESIDLRYISQRASFSNDGSWNLAGRVEATLRICRRIGALLGLSQPEVEQTLREATKGGTRIE